MFNLIKYMDRSRFHFTVGFYEDNIYRKKFSDMGIEVLLFKRDPVEWPNVLLRKAANWYRLRWRFQSLLKNVFKAKRIDLVVNNNSIWPALDFLGVCERLHIPLIAYERGYDGFHQAHIRSSRKLAASIPISRYIESKLVDHGFQAPRIRMIYDGIHPGGLQVESSQEAIKQRLGIPSHAMIIGSVGNIRPWKGQRYFVDAFNELSRRYPNLYGVVVGSAGNDPDNEAYLQDLQARLRPHLRETRLLFLGYHPNIREIFAVLDIFVHTSIKPEPFGMVILEAMASKTPVVATKMGGAMEIIDENDCGMLVPPQDSPSIVSACCQLLDDARLRDRIVGKAYDRLERRFDIRKTVQATSELFAEISGA